MPAFALARTICTTLTNTIRFGLELPDNKTGPGAARNFCWDHSIASGATWHWVVDDNLDAFHRMNRNVKAECETGVIFAAAEDFVERYENAPLAGFNYYCFCKETDALPPYTINTRIYSCLLIRNNLPMRWRGRYNEDTDLALRALKAGYCTIQFNAFLCGKVITQRMSGGNTAEFYLTEGTQKKSQILVDMHPDVAKVVWRFGRWHHHVDYSRFKRNKLVRNPNAVIPKGVNNYGMVLRKADRPSDSSISRSSVHDEQEASQFHWAGQAGPGVCGTVRVNGTAVPDSIHVQATLGSLRRL